MTFEEHIFPFRVPQSKEEQDQKREGPRKKVFVMSEDESEEIDPEEQPPEEQNPDGAIGEERNLVKEQLVKSRFKMSKHQEDQPERVDR